MTEPHLFLTEPLPQEVREVVDGLAEMPGVAHLAIMPDVHLSGRVCVGAVVGSRDRIFPEAVGGDIGCGIATVALDADADLLADRRRAERLFAGLRRLVPTHRHSRVTVVEELPPHLLAHRLTTSALERMKFRDGQVQYATLGRGNHFLEFQADESGRLWLAVHSGSRSMGQAITLHHLSVAERASDALAYLLVGSGSADSYLSDVAWARAYARGSRFAMLEATAILLDRQLGVRIDESTRYDCDHNHVQQEQHAGDWLWVHRKGALSARDGELGVIPGSMGTRTHHVSGRGCAAALHSSSHGAGRRSTRADAVRNISPTRLRREMANVHYDPSLVRALCEEAPTAYKDIGAVMRAQRALTRIVRTLRPILVYKGN